MENFLDLKNKYGCNEGKRDGKHMHQKEQQGKEVKTLNKGWIELQRTIEKNVNTSKFY